MRNTAHYLWQRNNKRRVKRYNTKYHRTAKYRRTLKRWRAKNREFLLRYRRDWRRRNRRRCLDTDRRWRDRNRGILKDRNRKWRRNHPEVGRDYELRTDYKNFSLEEYNKKFKKQGGLCAICKDRPRRTNRQRGRLDTDHNHKTGLVRGLLCFRCNAGLGLFRDRATLLRAAASYLSKCEKVRVQ